MGSSGGGLAVLRIINVGGDIFLDKRGGFYIKNCNSRDVLEKEFNCFEHSDNPFFNPKTGVYNLDVGGR